MRRDSRIFRTQTWRVKRFSTSAIESHESLSYVSRSDDEASDDKTWIAV